MNRYSLSSDSNRWWWPSGLAGVAAGAAIGSMLVVTMATAAPAKERDDLQHHGGYLPQSVASRVSVPCFARPLTWDIALDDPIPTCHVAWRH